jgi:lipopolysaccharide/colanic/teichoic acid biosynthesis glycosyltransferase
MVLRDEKSVARNSYARLSGDSVRGFGVSRYTKRAFDIVAALIGLTLFAPLLLLSCIAAAIESRHPIIIREDLHGYDNRIVRAFKFRLKANPSDPTRTRIGRMLHETGIAELPQLLNVLRGEMSIVGPRLSVRPQDIFEFQVMAKLSSVKPGLISWAPLAGDREQLGIAKQPIHDALHYIDNWSLSLDLRIILMSLFFSVKS